MLKSISTFFKNNKLIRLCIGYLIYCYIRLLFITYRLRTTYDFEFNEKEFNKNHGIFYFWHQHIIAGMFFFFKNGGVGHCIVSSSNDGKVIGFIAKKLGFNVIWGSNNKPSIKTAKTTLDVLETNKRLCLIGDGSRGPAFCLQKSVINLAKKSQVPLVFLECAVEWSLACKKSWDQFKIPMPFSKIHIRVHKPYLPEVKRPKPAVSICSPRSGS